MKNRLFHRLYLTTSVALIISTVLIMFLLSILVNNYFVNDKRQLLTDNCKTISNVISLQTDDLDSFEVSLVGVMSVVSNAVSGEAYASDAEGNVFICSCSEWVREKTCVHTKATISEKILKKVQDGSYFEIGHLNNRFNNNYYTAAMPFFASDGNILGYVFISSPASSLQKMWSELSAIYVMCAAVPLALLFVFLFFMTKRITRPINLMSSAAKSMSNGDFSQRIPVNGNDEISELAATFNAMSNSLTQLESMRRSFVANVSHELRTPMTTIGGFIDGILDGTIPCDKQEQYLLIVSAEVRRLSRLVQSMLSLAKLESGEQKPNPTEFSLNELACDVLLSQEQRIESKQIKIEGLDMDREIKIKADRDLLHQAFYNLVDNAIKFTPENGTISVCIKEVENGVSLSIRNDGKGIKPDEMQFIFDRFYKSDKARSQNKDGTGLGLYIVKTIVDIHGGNITVSSKPDVFTEFTIFLP